MFILLSRSSYRKIVLLLTICLLSFSHISMALEVESDPEQSCPKQTITPMPALQDDWLLFTGTVVYLEQEGGFYGLYSEDRQRYLPTELPELYQQDGLRVRVLVRQLSGQLSFKMWGQSVELHYIIATGCEL